MDKRERILAAAYAHFSTKGYQATTLDGIASSLKMSKKTIYFLFRNKEELFVEMGRWKLSDIVQESQGIINSDKPFVSKLIDYIELMYKSVRHISLPVLRTVFHDTNKLSKIVSDHVDTAVFDRFAALINQGRDEGMIDQRVDPMVSLMMYKETLTTFLFGKPLDYPAIEFEKEFHIFLSKQLRSFFRGILSKEGTIQFDELFDERSHLTRAYG
ncbi:MAG: TetR/AcrR family transcriptional regulator [Ekhidna sp.]|uniref:TetR/AcrR family transcriptional regulator n=1 Tax=Ekhidna sp. TaxID=2608089 RepID=UPI0032EE35F5